MPSYCFSTLKPKRKIAEEFTLRRATGFGGFNRDFHFGLNYPACYTQLAAENNEILSVAHA